MKTINKLILLLALLVSGMQAQSQRLYNIDLQVCEDKAAIQSVALICDSVVMRISPDGNIKLNARFPGNVEYYSAFDGDYRVGKLKLLANKTIDYYDQFNTENLNGKLKSAGNVNITYYDQFSSFDNIGRIKSAGNITFTYYDRYDGPDNIGKLKSIGNIKITYFDRFDGDQANLGKIKTVGNTTIAYFDQFDLNSPTGKVKSVTGDTPYLSVSRLNTYDVH